jgi:RND family efflux transporter MFP subunit
VARLAVEKSQIAIDLAQKTYDRQKQLAADQGTSAKSVEQAASDLASAQNDLATNQKQLALLEASPTPEDLAQENAKVAQAQAALVSAQVQRETLKIIAPIDGIVSQVNVNAGEAVDTTRTLVEIVAMDRLMVDADVPAEEISLLSEGEAVSVVPDKLAPDAPAPTPVDATITYVSPEIDRKTGTVQIGVDLPAGGAFRPGQTVKASITVATHKDCLAVPKQSIVKNDDGKPIICLVNGTTANWKKVVPGLQEGDLWEIQADGVEGGNFVVTDGAAGLPDGAKIKQIDDSAKDAD